MSSNNFERLNALRNKILLPSVFLFVAAEYVFAILAQTAKDAVWNISSFSSIVLVTLFFALFFEKSYDYLFTQLALVFTVAADYFLVLNDAEQKLPAMVCFTLVQLFYLVRIHVNLSGKRARLVHLATRCSAGVLAIALTLLVLGNGADALAVISVFYYSMLITNIIFAFMLRPACPVFAIGLLLFLGCDTFVGLGMIDEYLPVAEGSVLYYLAHPPINMAWLFYTPSQTLLGLSLLGKRFAITKKEK